MLAFTIPERCDQKAAGHELQKTPARAIHGSMTEVRESASEARR